MSIRNAYRQGFMSAGMGYDNPHGNSRCKAAWDRGLLDAENDFQFQPPSSSKPFIGVNHYFDTVKEHKVMYYQGGN